MEKKISAKKISSATSGLLLLAIIGVFQCASVGFDLSIYLEFEFYFRLFYRALIIFLAFNTAVDFTFDKVSNRQLVLDARTSYYNYNDKRKLNFKTYLEERNTQTKIKAFIDKINIKIAKLEKKAQACKNEKRFAKINEHISVYRTYICDDYIYSNINKIKVKYYKVHLSDFYCADYVSNNSDNKTRPEYAKAVAKYNLKNISKYLLISIVTGSAIYNFSTNNSVDFWINLLTDLMLIATRITQGVTSSTIIFDSEYTASYLNKVNILKEYIEWDVNNPNAAYEELLQEQEAKIKKEYDAKIEKVKELVKSS